MTSRRDYSSKPAQPSRLPRLIQCVRTAEAEMVLHIMFSSWSLCCLVAFHSVEHVCMYVEGCLHVSSNNGPNLVPDGIHTL